MYTGHKPSSKPRQPIGSRSYNEEWVTRNLDVRGHSGDEYDVLCVFHDDSNASMRINIAKGVSFCHGCGIGCPITKVARTLGVPYNGDRSEVDMAELLRKLDTLRHQGRGTDKPRTFLPESELKRYDFPTGYWTDPIGSGRGFTQETIDSFELGYDPMNDCVTIPIRDIHGHLLGFTRRFLDPHADKRYRDPKGFDKGSNLFGSWFAANDPRSTLVLTEGPLDAIKVWQAGFCAVAQFGSNLTEEQVKILRQMGFVSLILFYDNDSAGKKVTSSALGWITKDIRGKKVMCYEPAHDLRRSFVVRQVSYKGVATKDPGAMGDDQIAELASAAQLVYKSRQTFR